MPRTPENATVKYALSANFDLELPCRNQRLVKPETVDGDSEFLKKALERLKDLAEQGLQALEEGESPPIAIESYDADLFAEGELFESY